MGGPGDPPPRHGLCYLPRALSRLFLMASKKSLVFIKCSFSFTLGRGTERGWEGPTASSSTKLS